MANVHCTYQWKNRPRIVTYTNPKKLKENLDIAMLMKNSVQLCASDTLIQGLISRYGRDSFGILCSVNHFQEMLFNYELTGAKQSLQMFLKVKDCIEKIDNKVENKSVNCRNAFEQNTQSLVESFRFLAMSDYDENIESLNLSDEQKIFFDYIYKPLIGEYRSHYRNLVQEVEKKDILLTCHRALCQDVDRLLGTENGRKTNNLEEAQKLLDDFHPNSYRARKEKSALEDLIEQNKNKGIDIIIIHGVIRFTPEIMMLIEALDRKSSIMSTTQ